MLITLQDLYFEHLMSAKRANKSVGNLCDKDMIDVVHTLFTEFSQDMITIVHNIEVARDREGTTERAKEVADWVIKALHFGWFQTFKFPLGELHLELSPACCSKAFAIMCVEHGTRLAWRTIQKCPKRDRQPGFQNPPESL